MITKWYSDGTTTANKGAVALSSQYNAWSPVARRDAPELIEARDTEAITCR